MGQRVEARATHSGSIDDAWENIHQQHSRDHQSAHELISPCSSLQRRAAGLFRRLGDGDKDVKASAPGAANDPQHPGTRLRCPQLRNWTRDAARFPMLVPLFREAARVCKQNEGDDKANTDIVKPSQD